MQLVLRTLATLRALGHSSPRAMQELATSLDIPLPSMHRLLATLEGEGFVLRLPDGRYVLGPEALALAAGARPLEQVCHPRMEGLAAKTGATVFLTEMLQDKAICTGLVQGSGALRLFVHVGQQMPLHAAASSRTLLSQLPVARVREILKHRELSSFMPDTPTTLPEVEDRVRVTRERGFDVCYNELDPGVLAVSAPVRGWMSGPASLTLAAPRGKAEGHSPEWSDLLVTAAADISRELGFTG